MKEKRVKGIKFFIDFDGTITLEDVVDRVLDRFASGEWKKVEREWVEGKIGSRECLSRQMSLVSAKQEAKAGGEGTPIIEWFMETKNRLGAEVRFMSSTSEQSEQLLKAFSGVAAILRFPVFAASSDDDEADNSADSDDDDEFW